MSEGIIVYGGERQSSTARSEFDCRLIYADSNCDIVGSFVDKGEYYDTDVIFDMRIKRGWNWLFQIHEENIEGQVFYKYTTDIPAGAVFSFYKTNPPWRTDNGGGRLVAPSFRRSRE
jgi:hypothetical protein